MLGVEPHVLGKWNESIFRFLCLELNGLLKLERVLELDLEPK